MSDEAFVRAWDRVREREGRRPSDAVVARWPVTEVDDPDAALWRMRAWMWARVARHLERARVTSVLDVACGNGWMSARAAALACSPAVVGIDVDDRALAQANRLFASPRVEFSQVNRRLEPLPGRRFDAILLAGALAYFDDVAAVVEALRSRLTPRGELHIFDGPLYATERDVERAAAASARHFADVGVPEMRAFYHHHRMASLLALGAEIAYDPRTARSRLARAVGRPRSPFPWLIVRRA